MKKSLCFLSLTLVVMLLFSACKNKTNVSSETESVFLPSGETSSTVSESSQKIRPPMEDIIGLYTIKGSKRDEVVWKVYVKLQPGNKLTVQVVSPNQEPKELTEDILEKITSAYDPETGKFYQSYVTEDHTSVYEAFFSVENGKIKIDLANTYFYHSDGILKNGIQGIGYMEAVEEEQ